MQQTEEFTIRPAQPQDIDAMLRLIQELADFEQAPHEVTVSKQHFEESGFGSHPVWWAWVAVDAAQHIIAFALYYIRYSTWKGQRLYLEDIIVTEEWRGKGVGSALFQQLILDTQIKELNGISFQVLNWNSNAITFYNKFGAKFDGEWLNVQVNI